MAILFSLLLLATVVAAAPSISLPINSQVPPVIRISKPFQFVFSTSTFTSNISDLIYSLSGSPKWLQLDSPSRTLSGIPSAANVGPFIFNLVAADSSGATPMTVTLIVSASAGPGLGLSVTDQISSLQTFSPPNSLLLYRAGHLSVSFSGNTFTNTDQNTLYYAFCADNAPLPSWIAFDSSSLSFTGTVPESTSPAELPQTYAIHLSASDIAGFAGATVTFQVVVGNHELRFESAEQILNVTKGSSFNFTGLNTNLKLDGNTVKLEDVRQMTVDPPSWMTFDPKSFVLSGTPPMSATSQQILVMVNDIYGDESNTSIIVQVSANTTTTLFEDTLGPINATIGSDFTYNFNRTLFSNPGVHISLDLGNSSTWLSFDSSQLELQGHVPIDLQPGKSQINITATLGSQTQSQLLIINLLKAGLQRPNQNTVLPSSSSKTMSISSSTLESRPSSPNKPKTDNRTIAVAVAIPLVILLGAVAMIALCKKRSRNKGYPLNSPRDISRPILVAGSNSESAAEDPPEMIHIAKRRALSKAPKIKLPSVYREPIEEIPGVWPPSPKKRRSQHRWSKIGDENIVAGRMSSRDSDRRQSSSIMILDPEFSLSIPEENQTQAKPTSNYSRRLQMRRSKPLTMTEDTLARKTTKHRSERSWPSSNVLASPPMSGVGHGNGVDQSRGIGRGLGFHTGSNSQGPFSFSVFPKFPQHGVVPTSHSEQSSEWNTSNSSASQHLSNADSFFGSQHRTDLSEFPAVPQKVILDPVHQTVRRVPSSSGDQSSHFPNEITIRPVTSISEKYLTSISSLRDKYIQHRKRSRLPSNPLFSAGTASSRASSEQWTKSIKAPLGEHKDISNPANPASPSSVLSSQLVRTPNQPAWSTALPLTPIAANARHKVRKHYSKRACKGIGLPISKYQQSRESMASEGKYASALSDLDDPSNNEEDGPNNNDDDDEDQPPSATRYKHYGIAQPLDTEGNAEDLDAGIRPAIAQRLSWLRARQVGEEKKKEKEKSASVASGGQEMSGIGFTGLEESGHILVGRRGKRPVSRDVEMGLRPGRPGSLSLRGEVAFI